MRILFIGTVEFSRNTLLRCISHKANIVGIITRQRSPINSDFASLVPIASKYSIPIECTTDINDKKTIDWIKDKRPDYIFCFGWSTLLRSDLLSIPRLGVVGFHPSALPKNRGRHPLVWALALGLKETASTFYFMDSSADSGDLLSQEIVPITYEDNARSLYNKVTEIAMSQIDSILPMLFSGIVPKISQDHHLSNFWRKRSHEDGRIDFRMSSRSIYNLIRSLSEPYPGAHIRQGQNEIIVWNASEIDCMFNNIEPGKVLTINKDGILVKCGEGAILLTDHEFREPPKLGDYL